MSPYQLIKKASLASVNLVIY
ncbi:hypothetical protein AZZ95_002763, partial [Enterobacter roggenkampii]